MGCVVRAVLFWECEVQISMAEVGTGNRFVCTVCNAEFIVTKGGDASIVCDGKPVEPKK